MPNEQQGRIDPAVKQFVRRDSAFGWHVPAWKAAVFAAIDDDRPLFRPLRTTSGYGLDSIATCSLRCEETPPNLSCSCGFYAVSDKDYVPSYARSMVGAVRLEVILQGRVAFFQSIFANSVCIMRAQYQRIVSYESPLDWRETARNERARELAWLDEQLRPQPPRPEEDGGAIARRVPPHGPRPEPDWILVPTPDWVITEEPMTGFPQELQHEFMSL